MKRKSILALLLVAVVVVSLSLVGCGRNYSRSKTGNNATRNNATGTPNTGTDGTAGSGTGGIGRAGGGAGSGGIRGVGTRGRIAASAGGSVVCSPNPVPHGGNATCTATASSGYRFTGWGGSCSGSASPCTLTNVTAPTNVSVQFAPASAQAIPTLGEWAMLLLTGLMGMGAMVALRRR